MKNVIMGASTQISGFSPSAEHKATQSNERKIAVSCHVASGNIACSVNRENAVQGLTDWEKSQFML